MVNKDLTRWMFRRKVPLKGDRGDEGQEGSLGPQGPSGATGAVNVVSLTAPSRSFGVPFQPSTTRPVLCSYSIQQTCTVTLGGDIETTVEFRCDSFNPPTTVRERIKLRHALGLGIGVGQTVEHIIPLRFVVPIGHWVNIVAITEAGSTAAINAQCEEVL